MGAIETAASPRRVLVVDDHPDSAQSYCELLTLMGHLCKFTTDARQALEVARTFKPQIALLDIGLLPELDGHQVARLLRQEFGEGIQLIAVTAYGRDEDRARTRRAGFDAHITKPIDASMLESILNHTL